MSKHHCPTCVGPNRETVGMICQTCGTDFGSGYDFTLPNGDEVHVVPSDDLVTHTTSEDCACGPTADAVRREDGSVGWVQIHHSLDGREATE